ncbi:MAG: ABC transporter ATP-binding protein [Candidatus Berkelbacteria bacterium]
MQKVISVKKLIKKYRDLTAVDGISFDVNRGEIFGLLGENGAGKTTTLEMIEGLRRPTSGKIEVLGCDIIEHRDAVKEKIGVQLQSSAYYGFLTLKEILELFASFYAKNIPAAELLKMVDLEKKANSYIGSLSGGQRQRFSIVASLVNDPEVVFLDEPTTGLDPIARRNLWDLISKIKNQGKTVILTTHYMEEAEILCDRVAIMESGKILVMDETHKLIEAAKFPFTISFIRKNINQKTLADLGKLAVVENIFGKENKYVLKIKNQKNMNLALKLVQSLKPESLTVGRATLEDLFIELTGKRVEE